MVSGRHEVTITTLYFKDLILSPHPRVLEGLQLLSITKPQGVPLWLEGRACRSLHFLLWVASAAKL